MHEADRGRSSGGDSARSGLAGVLVAMLALSATLVPAVFHGHARRAAATRDGQGGDSSCARAGDPREVGAGADRPRSCADLRDPRAIANAVAHSHAVRVLCPMIARLTDPEAEAAIIIDALVEGLGIAEPPAVLAISDYGAEIPSGTGITTILHQLEAR
jgi:NAD(P)H dehydrogenase (quinone)